MTQAEKLERVLENKKVCRISKSEFFSNPDSIDVLRCENLKGLIWYNENHDIAIAMSSSSRADTASVLAGCI